MVRKIDQKTIVRELSVSFLQVHEVCHDPREIAQLHLLLALVKSIIIKRKFMPKNAVFLLKNPENRWVPLDPHSLILNSFGFPDFLSKSAGIPVQPPKPFQI